ncbi:MAG: hypothetical protein IKG93_03500 [Clostridiales bacterium]|nr:hypothetical protein [Clostridiales bacterium]
MSKPKSIMKQVRSYNMRNRLIIGLVLLAIAFVLCFITMPKTTKYLLATKNVFSEPYTRLGNDKFYRGNTNYMYDWFADNDDGRFYLAPVEDAVGNPGYLVVYVPNSLVDDAEAVADQTLEYRISGDASVAKKTISCRGYTTETTSKIRMYLDQFLSSVQATNDMRENIADYMFVMVPAKQVFFGNGDTLISLLLFVFIGGIGLYLLIAAFAGGYMRKFKKSLQTNNISVEELDADMENSMNISRLLVGDKYLVESNMSPRVRKIEDIVWVYPQRTNTNGSQTTYQVVAYTRNRECLKYAMHSQAESESLCKHILSRQPRALYGYVIENSTMYFSRFGELIDRIYNQPESPAPEQSSEDASANGNTVTDQNLSSEEAQISSETVLPDPSTMYPPPPSDDDPFSDASLQALSNESGTPMGSPFKPSYDKPDYSKNDDNNNDILRPGI